MESFTLLRAAASDIVLYVSLKGVAMLLSNDGWIESEHGRGGS